MQQPNELTREQRLAPERLAKMRELAAVAVAVNEWPMTVGGPDALALLDRIAELEAQLEEANKVGIQSAISVLNKANETNGANFVEEFMQVKNERDELRYALRQAIINAGGVAEPEVSHEFLLLVPAEVGALKCKLSEITKSRDSALALAAMRGDSLRAIASAKAKWQSNVGSYAGGETYSGFAQRLQNMARDAAESSDPEKWLAERDKPMRAEGAIGVVKDLAKELRDRGSESLAAAYESLATQLRKEAGLKQLGSAASDDLER